MRAELLSDTHAAAWRIAEAEGINDLTMTAVARQVGVGPPALYRYFNGRDGLIHALYQDCHRPILQHVTEATERQDPGGISAQLHVASRAVFDWSVAHPAAFGLLMGSAYRTAANSGDEVPRVISSALGGLFGICFARLWEEGRLTYPEDTAGVWRRANSGRPDCVTVQLVRSDQNVFSRSQASCATSIVRWSASEWRAPQSPSVAGVVPSWLGTRQKTNPAGDRMLA